MLLFLWLQTTSIFKVLDTWGPFHIEMDMRKTPKGIQTFLARFYHYFLVLSLKSASDFWPHLTMRACHSLASQTLNKKGSEKDTNDGFVSMGRLFNGWLPLITISPKPLTIPPTPNFSIVQVNSSKMGGLILMSSSSSNIIISLMQSRRKGKVSWDECLSEQGPLTLFHP